MAFIFSLKHGATSPRGSEDVDDVDQDYRRAG